MIIISEEQVNDILDENNTRGIIRDTLKSVSLGDVQQVLRSALHLTNNNVFGMMPCHLASKNVFGAKMISVFPENSKQSLKSHQGVVVLFDDRNGKTLGLVDADAITAMRTAAVSAVATDELALKDSKYLAVLGAGLQGEQHIKAINAVRQLEKVFLWDPHPAFAKKRAEELSKKTGLDIVSFSQAKDAVKNADIICTVTTLREPVLQYEWLKEGVHINAVGACTPDAREIDSKTICHANIYVDSRESVLNESGDLLMPMYDGLIDENHIVAEIGEVIAGIKEGRTNKEITLFESLGLASEDIAVAQYVYSQVMEGDKSDIL